MVGFAPRDYCEIKIHFSADPPVAAGRGFRMAPRPAQPRRINPLATIGWAGIILLFVVVLLIVWLFSSPKALDYSDVIALAKKGKIEKVTFVGKDRLEG